MYIGLLARASFKASYSVNNLIILRESRPA
jgi:hypothetical protein